MLVLFLCSPCRLPPRPAIRTGCPTGAPRRAVLLLGSAVKAALAYVAPSLGSLSVSVFALVGAMDSLFECLASLSRRLLSAPQKHLQSIPRTWIDSLLLLLVPAAGAITRLLLPRASSSAELDCSTESKDQGSRDSAFALQSVLGTQSDLDDDSEQICAASLPPPLRKSASLGLAFVAVLAGNEQTQQLP